MTLHVGQQFLQALAGGVQVFEGGANALVFFGVVARQQAGQGLDSPAGRSPLAAIPPARAPASRAAHRAGGRRSRCSRAWSLPAPLRSTRRRRKLPGRAVEALDQPVRCTDRDVRIGDGTVEAGEDVPQLRVSFSSATNWRNSAVICTRLANAESAFLMMSGNAGSVRRGDGSWVGGAPAARGGRKSRKRPPVKERLATTARVP